MYKKEKEGRKDLLGTKCDCGNVFEERHIYNDWEGTVTCMCGKTVKRWSVPRKRDK